MSADSIVLVPATDAGQQWPAPETSLLQEPTLLLNVPYRSRLIPVHCELQFRKVVYVPR